LGSVCQGAGVGFGERMSGCRVWGLGETRCRVWGGGSVRESKIHSFHLAFQFCRFARPPTTRQCRFAPSPPPSSGSARESAVKRKIVVVVYVQVMSSYIKSQKWIHSFHFTFQFYRFATPPVRLHHFTDSRPVYICVTTTTSTAPTPTTFHFTPPTPSATEIFATPLRQASAIHVQGEWGPRQAAPWSVMERERERERESER